MIVAVLIGCVGAVFLGKRDAARGENLQKQRDEWLEKQLAKDKNN